MKVTICDRSYESQYEFHEKRQPLGIFYIGIHVVLFNHSSRKEKKFKAVKFNIDQR